MAVESTPDGASGVLDDVPRPSAMWRALSDERRSTAALAFWSETDAVEYQYEAVALIAGRLKFRPKSVLTLPLERRARALASIKSLPETIALRALVSYHLQHQRPMMASFLDSLGIAHEEGLIQEEEMTAPPSDRLLAAAAELGQQCSPEDVRLYLSTLVVQDPGTWGGLSEVLKK